MNFKSKTQKQGGSLMLPIPFEIVREFEIKEGDDFWITNENPLKKICEQFQENKELVVLVDGDDQTLTGTIAGVGESSVTIFSSQNYVVSFDFIKSLSKIITPQEANGETIKLGEEDE